MDKLTSKKTAIVESFSSLLGGLVAGVLAVVSAGLVILFFCGLYQAEADFKQQTMGVAQKSEYHKLAVESYLDCKDSLFPSKQQCLVTSVQLAQQAGLKDTTQLTMDIRELTAGSDLSISELAAAGYRFINPF